MNNFIKKQIDGSEPIHFPQCPRCQTNIRRCQRYLSITNRIQSWIEQIKKKQQNNIQPSELIKEYGELFEVLKNSFEKIKSIEQKSLQTLINRLNKKTKSVNIDELNYLKNTCAFFTEIKYANSLNHSF